MAIYTNAIQVPAARVAEGTIETGLQPHTHPPTHSHLLRAMHRYSGGDAPETRKSYRASTRRQKMELKKKKKWTGRDIRRSWAFLLTRRVTKNNTGCICRHHHHRHHRDVVTRRAQQTAEIERGFVWRKVDDDDENLAWRLRAKVRE